MFSEVYNTTQEFEENCLCASAVNNFIDTKIISNVKWFFDKCFMFENHQRYSIIFSSYALPDYKGYIMGLEARYNVNSDSYDIKLIKKAESPTLDNK